MGKTLEEKYLKENYVKTKLKCSPELSGFGNVFYIEKDGTTWMKKIRR